MALLVEALREFAEVRVVATQPAMHFVRTLSEEAQAAIGEVLGDDMEWRQWQQASAFPARARVMRLHLHACASSGEDGPM